MVLGPRRIKAGVQPLNKNMGPSFCNERVRTSSGFLLPDYYRPYEWQYYDEKSVPRTEDISRDLITSAGEQMAKMHDVRFKPM
jgi:hypothetical protein